MLHGSDGGDLIDGGDDDDTLRGGKEHDRLLGGDGDDVLHGGDHGDLLRGGDGDDVLHGDQRRDALYGGDGDDTLHGGEGWDDLEGGGGNDVLTGGDGEDVFYFLLKDGRQNDRITDFENGADLLVLQGFAPAGFGDDDLAGVIAAARSGASVKGVVIDLTAHGGGTILLEGFDAAGLDASDFSIFSF